MNRALVLSKLQKKPSKGRLESEVQAGISAYLDLRSDLWWWRANTGGAWFGNFFVRFGKKGAPDIHGLQAPEGRFFVVECKREIGGELSPAQERWRDNFISFGGLYIGPARSVDDVVAGLGSVRAHVTKIPMTQRVYRR